MEEAVRRFIERWLDNNVRAEGYEEPGSLSEAHRLAEMCRFSAEQHGISPKQLDETAASMVGGGENLVALMSNAIEEANDAEGARQFERDN